MLDFDPDEVEAHFAQDHVLQMVLLLIELKLNVETLLDSDLHLDLLVLFLLLLTVLLSCLLLARRDILHDEVLLLRHSIVLPVNADIDVVAHTHIDALVSLKLLLDSVECKVVRHVVSERAGRLEVAHELREGRIVRLVELVLDEAD